MAYEHRLAVCAFDLRLDRAPVGLDAAHIGWKQAGGPVFFLRPTGLWMIRLSTEHCNPEVESERMWP